MHQKQEVDPLQIVTPLTIGSVSQNQLKRLFLLIFSAFCLLSHPMQLLADDSRSVCWITESWPKFTQEDGKGVYHELVKAVFASQGIKVDIQYAPWKRAVENVRRGLCDMTGGIEPNQAYYQSKYPLFEFHNQIIFKKGTIDWKGPQSLEGKSGVWVRGSISKVTDSEILNHAEGYQTENYEQALRMLFRNRVGFLISGSLAFKNHMGLVEGMQIKDYDLVEYATGQLYMSFTKNEKGASLKKQYDQGIESLSGEKIQAIYRKWGLVAPRFSSTVE